MRATVQVLRPHTHGARSPRFNPHRHCVAWLAWSTLLAERDEKTGRDRGVMASCVALDAPLDRDRFSTA
jgi:hypothetical protein